MTVNFGTAMIGMNDWDERKKDLKTHREFWISKIERNMERDRDVTEKLEAEGWTVHRFWGKNIKKHLTESAVRSRE